MDVPLNSRCGTMRAIVRPALIKSKIGMPEGWVLKDEGDRKRPDIIYWAAYV